MENINRKKFFTLVGFSALATTVLNLFPTKIFASVSKASEKKIKVNIHPEAVKRIKKV